MRRAGGIPRRALARFASEQGGATAVEFGLVAFPFILFLLVILQLGIYYMTQSALDAAIIKTADGLRNNFTTTSVTTPNAATLKSTVAGNAGGLIKNDSTLAVEIRQLATLSAAVVPVVDATNDYGTSTSTLVLRAESTAIAFAPGFNTLTKVRSSALVRRQGR